MLAKIKSFGQCDEEFDVDLRDCSFLGEGHNGIVYRLPDGRVIKIFKDKKNCGKEYFILKNTSRSKYFPNTYACGGNYIVRDYVGGECAKDYIKTHGLSRKLVVNLILLLEEFKKLNFTKLDIRCRDLFVQEDESLLVIDPKGSYSRKVSYPRHLAKGLKKLGVLEDMLSTVKQERPELYKCWFDKMKKVGLI